jgi:pyridoxamine 5'-phosphate oxidase
MTGRTEPGQAGEPGLSESDLGPDPLARIAAWLEDARAAGVLFPDAAAIATSGAEGQPTVRHVLVKTIDERGLVFFTNRQSRKAGQLSENPRASLAFLWRELERQVCATGTVTRVDDEESDTYFASRPREARIGAWASAQSRPVSSREALDAAYAEMQARFPGEEIPRPPHWGGYRLRPDTIEFWKGRAHRLHDRFLFTRSDDGWDVGRLWP